MDPTILAAIVGGIAGVVTGGLSSVVAPWAQWGVEQRRERLKQRSALVASWRVLVASIDGMVLGEPLARYLRRRAEYPALRHNLSPEEVRLIEGTPPAAELESYLKRKGFHAHGPDLQTEVLRIVVEQVVKRWHLD